MADNYLERRMEEHRASQQALRQSSRPTRQIPGRVVVDYPPFRVLVTDADTPAGEAIVRAFVAMKCHVSITTGLCSRGPSTAQRTGARYIPGSAQKALEWHARHNEPVTAIIDPVAQLVTLLNELPGRSISIDSRAISGGHEAVASWCVFSLHPANRWIFNA